MKPMKALTAAVALACATVAAQAEDLVIWMRTPSATENQALQKIMKEFEAANPGVNVKLETRSVDEHKSALRIAATSKGGPDIYYMWTGLGLGGEYVKSGLSAPLDDYYAKYKWADRVRPLADSYSTQYPPHRHGVPYQLNAEAIYYNKALFKKAGIDTPPKTYAELVADADKLKKAGIAPITFGGSVNWHVMRLMDNLLETQCGAKTHDALKAMTIKWTDTPCTTAAFTEFQKWNANYILKPYMSFDHTQSRKLFEADRAAMMLEGDWLVGQLKTEAPNKKPDDFGVFPFPTGTDRLYGFGVNLYVNPYSKNKDLAAKFLDYFESDKVQQEHLGAFGALGTSKNVVHKSPDSLTATWLDMFGKYKNAFVNGDQAFPLDVTTEYFRVINLVATDALEPAKAPATLQTFIDKRKP